MWTVGHGTRPAEELVDLLREAGVLTVVDVRRFPGSRRNPQFGRGPLEESLRRAGIGYVHAPDLGGRRSRVEGDDRFDCVRVAAFRSYASWMGSPEWAAALDAALELPRPCFLCAETVPWRCHRRLVADALAARGVEVVHLVSPGAPLPHRPFPGSEARDGVLYLCGARVV